MEVIVELPPLRDFGKLASLVRELEEFVDGFDIPDSPLGLQLPAAPLLAIKLSCITGKTLIPHIRVIDHTVAGVVNIVEALKAAGISSFVLLRGDPPPIGKPLDARTEDYAATIRERIGGVRVGGLISLRWGLKSLSRIRSGLFDFFLVLRAVEADDDTLERVISEARLRGVRLYAYILIRTGERIPKLVSGQPILSLDEVGKHVSRLSVFDGVIVSSVGGGLKEMVNAVKIVSKIF